MPLIVSMIKILSDYTRKNAHSHKLLQTCELVVTGLLKSSRQVVFAQTVKLLTTCNKLGGVIRLVTRLFQQD